jgi:hypothetical protein
MYQKKSKKEDLKHKYEFEMEGIKKNDRHKFIREVNLEKDRKIEMNRNRKKKTKSQVNLFPACA